MGDDEARQPGIAKGEPAPSDAEVKERMASPPPVKVVAPVLCAGDAGSKCARWEGACGLGGASWFDGVCAREVGAGRRGYWLPDLCDKGQEGKGEDSPHHCEARHRGAIGGRSGSGPRRSRARWGRANAWPGTGPRGAEGSGKEDARH